MGPVLRPGNATTLALKTQLNQRQLACGRDLHPGQEQVGSFALVSFPRVAKFSFGEALALVDNRRLWGRALGWTDIHLLTSALVSRTRLWTRDRLLRDTAGQLRIPIKA